MLFHVCVCGSLARAARTRWGGSLKETVPFLVCERCSHVGAVRTRQGKSIAYYTYPTGTPRLPESHPWRWWMYSIHPQISLPGFRLALACLAMEQGSGG